MPEICTRRATPAASASRATGLRPLYVHSLEGHPTLLNVGRDRVDDGVGPRNGSGNGRPVAHIGRDERDQVGTERSQLNSRRIWMPHSDAYTHTRGRQAVHQSPTEETPTTKHHNCRHLLLRKQGNRFKMAQPSTLSSSENLAARNRQPASSDLGPIDVERCRDGQRLSERQ